ncbi:DUF6783 domain-containing protein [Ruminococcus sp. RTP21358st1_A5_RTP21358_211008]|uniref:DUF6783 domain-containing protein n=2 Tax=Bacillota TaxID=1239 RepID=UPI0034A3C87D
MRFTICGGFIQRKIREAIMAVTQYSMAKYTAKQGMKIAGMIFQTCSRLIELRICRNFKIIQIKQLNYL